MPPRYAIVNHLKEEEEEERLDFLGHTHNHLESETELRNLTHDGGLQQHDGLSEDDGARSGWEEGGGAHSVAAVGDEVTSRVGTRRNEHQSYVGDAVYRSRYRRRNGGGALVESGLWDKLSELIKSPTTIWQQLSNGDGGSPTASPSREQRRARRSQQRGGGGGSEGWRGTWRTLSIAVASSQSWLAAALLGVLAAFCAAFVDVASHWLLDLKLGYCADQMWGSALVCCADTNVLMPLAALSRIQSLSNFTSGSTTSGTPLVSFQQEHASALALSGVSTLQGLGGNISRIAYHTDSHEYGYTECDAFRTWNLVFADSTGLSGFCMYAGVSAALAITAAILCSYYAPNAAGSGIVEIKAILSGVVIPGFFEPNVLVIKVVGVCAAVASGLTLGKEGPFVHIGCCIAMFVARLFPSLRKSDTKQRELLSCGVAVGVAVAFGAPIGGVLFAVEELSFQFPHKTVMQALLTTTVATLILKKLDPLDTGHIVQFAVTYSHPWHWFELLPFAFVGVMGGVIGSYLTLGMSAMGQLRKALTSMSASSSSSTPSRIGRFIITSSPYTEVVFTTIITAVFCYSNMLTRYSMLDVLSALLVDCSGASLRENDHTPVAAALCLGDTTSGLAASSSPFGHEEMLVMTKIVYAVLARSALLLITSGLKVPSGIFVPSLFIGAAGGRLVGVLMQALTSMPSSANWLISWLNYVVFQECAIVGTGQEATAPPTSSSPSSSSSSLHGANCIYPGVYAMVGAVAVLSGVTRMTLCLVVIMFELTGDIEYTVPCMIGVILAKWAGDNLMKVPSLYDMQMQLSNYPFIDPKEEFRGQVSTGVVSQLRLKLLEAADASIITASPAAEAVGINGGGREDEDTDGGDAAEVNGNAADVGAAYTRAQYCADVETFIDNLQQRSQRELLTAGDLVTYLRFCRQQRSGSGDVVVLENLVSLAETKAVTLNFPHGRYPVVRHVSEDAPLLPTPPTELGSSARPHHRHRVSSTSSKKARVLVGSVTSDEIQRAIRMSELRQVPSSLLVTFSQQQHHYQAAAGSPDIHLSPNNVAAAIDWSGYLDRCSTVVSESLSINRLLQSFKALGLGHVVVTQGPYLVDIISRSDILEFVKALGS